MLTKKTVQLFANAPSHEYTLARVEQGSTEGLRKLLDGCALCFEYGVPPPKAFRAILAKRCREIAASRDPWSERFLKRKRGQRSADLFDSQFAIATEVWLLHKPQQEEDGAPLRTRRSVRASAEIVSVRHGITADHAEELYYKYRPALDGDETQSTVAAILRASTLTLTLEVPKRTR